MICRYHDMSGVVDFIILRQTYNIAMSRNWNLGECHIMCILVHVLVSCTFLLVSICL